MNVDVLADEETGLLYFLLCEKKGLARQVVAILPEMEALKLAQRILGEYDKRRPAGKRERALPSRTVMGGQHGGEDGE